MSFILDALKKSEAERQRQAGPALLEMRVVRPRRSTPVWVLAGGGALLLINLVLVGWLFLRPRSEPPAAAPAVAASVPVPSPTAAAQAVTPAPAETAPPRIVAGGAAAAGATAALGDEPAAAGDSGNPADFAPAASERGSVTVEHDPSALQSYNEVSGRMPEVHLDLHVYSPNAAERYAFINLHKVREGETTAEGMRVVEITRDGVVLQYQGMEFLLGHE